MTQAESWLRRQDWPEDHRDALIRDRFTQTFGFAVLTHEEIRLIQGYGPILEIGAGTGYWAMELSHAGTSIIATGPGYSREYFRDSPRWTEVLPLEARDAIWQHPGRNLLMCWPHTAGWTWEAARTFQGKHLIYVGENGMGCTGGPVLNETPEERYRLSREIEIPRFQGMHDRLQVWTRKA